MVPKEPMRHGADPGLRRRAMKAILLWWRAPDGPM
jgi:hypothetical protein